MSHKKWIVADADKEKASVLSEKLNIDPFLAFLLVSRGIDNELCASDFLSDSCVCTSPYSLKDMDKAVERITLALESDQKICIYGDYDCDGVTSTALLYSFFESIGADVIYYIPNRLTDGYGMNFGAIDYIKSQDVDLIVTVDNGISSFDEADYIYSLGMELIVTDHHQIGDRLPRAYAVVNPHREDNDIDFRDFAGVGVAFKLACAIDGGDVEEMIALYADLVAIGTIGDIVPLVSENRGLVRAGLELINMNVREGINALRIAAGNDDRELTATDVAFQLCPRINAAGRMDHAKKAVELLISEDYNDAKFKAQQLNDNNIYRHEVETDIIDAIHSKIAEEPALVEDRVIIIDGRNFHHGVIGIVASNIVSAYGKPAMIIGVDDDGEGTGSARSIDGFNIYDAIASCSDMLTHFGGHPLAAGFGIREEDIPQFRKKINEFAKANYPVMPPETLHIDCKLSPFYLDTVLVDNLKVLEPYGAKNPEAVFGLFNVELVNVTPIGDGKHIRIEVQKKGRKFKVVKFKTSMDELAYKQGDFIDLAVKVSKNIFKGKYYLSIRAVDIRKSKIDDDIYFAQKSDYELFKLGFNNKTEMYPTREIFAVIYKFLKKNNGWQYSFDDLYFALEQRVPYGTLKFAIEAFEQAGLLVVNNDKIILKQVTEKAVLENTQVMITLKGRLNIE